MTTAADAVGGQVAPPETAAPAGGRHKVILAGIVGNVLEWYDFAVYGFFAPVIARLFFPDTDPVASLIAAYGAFAAGFIARPFGGAIFGHIGDRYGRRMALTLSVLLMAIPTFLLGLLPTFADWGVASTILLVVLRMLQGLSVGGEYTTSTVFLVEQAPHGRRGFYGSWSNAGVVIGVLVGSGFGALIYGFLPDADIESWGWRVPFIVGLFVGIGGIFLRRHVTDAPVSDSAKHGPSPVVVAFRDELPAMLKVIGFALTDAVGFYLIFVYITTFLIEQVKLPATDAFDINTASMIVLAVLVPLGGILSDKIGRKPVMLIATGGIALLSWPLLWLMHHPDDLMVLAGQMVFVLLIGLYYGGGTATTAEVFPARVRCSALAVGYNLCLALFGGTTPMVATFLIEHTGQDLSIAFYLAAAGAISFLVTLRFPETYRMPLR